jgi:predicted DNA-binding protein YlxM (UPF0122 family)
LDHYMKPLDKKEIDKILRQIGKDRPDLDTLEKNEMASLSHIGHLYVLDNVTLKELSEFWGISKNGVRNRLKEKVKSKSWLFKLADKSENAKIKLCPSDAFPDIGEYINFLKWRSVCRKEKSISISEAVAVLGISKRTVYRYIKNGDLHACGTDETMIMRFSFNTLVQKTILETEIKLKTMKDHIHKYQRDISIHKTTHVPAFATHDTKPGSHVPAFATHDTKPGSHVPAFATHDTKPGSHVPAFATRDTKPGSHVPAFVTHDTINGT